MAPTPPRHISRQATLAQEDGQQIRVRKTKMPSRTHSPASSLTGRLRQDSFHATPWFSSGPSTPRLSKMLPSSPSSSESAQRPLPPLRTTATFPQEAEDPQQRESPGGGAMDIDPLPSQQHSRCRGDLDDDEVQYNSASNEDDELPSQSPLQGRRDDRSQCSRHDRHRDGHTGNGGLSCTEIEDSSAPGQFGDPIFLHNSKNTKLTYQSRAREISDTIDRFFREGLPILHRPDTPRQGSHAEPQATSRWPRHMQWQWIDIASEFLSSRPGYTTLANKCCQYNTLLFLNGGSTGSTLRYWQQRDRIQPG